MKSIIELIKENTQSNEIVALNYLDIDFKESMSEEQVENALKGIIEGNIEFSISFKGAHQTEYLYKAGGVKIYCNVELKKLLFN